VVRRHAGGETGPFGVLDVAQQLRGTDLLVGAVEADDRHAVGIPVLPSPYVYVRFAAEAVRGSP
jgi:hypothetical protein